MSVILKPHVARFSTAEYPVLTQAALPEPYSNCCVLATLIGSPVPQSGSLLFLKGAWLLHRSVAVGRDGAMKPGGRGRGKGRRELIRGAC